MTESEWLASTAPKAMLRKASDRQLRLFACACCWANGRKATDINSWEQWGNPHKTDSKWAEAWVQPNDEGPSRDVQADLLRMIVGNPFRADLLRMIVGNPFRPVTLDPRCLTPTVRGLAQAAYEERVAEVCPACRGHCTCNLCGQTGRIETGQLDPDRLGVLADASEDAGCEEEALLRALRGEEPCAACEVERRTDKGTTILQLAGASVKLGGKETSPIYLSECRNCHGSGWRPRRVPAYRGFWCLDVLMGRNHDARN